MSRFDVTDLPLAGLKLLERKPIGDSRGFFVRIFCAKDLAPAGWNGHVEQINQSYTAQRGAVRGMHFQTPPHSEIKVVTCLRGAIYDVAVDLRRGSPTFLRWHGELLSAENCRALLIPKGFAHGFQTLSADVEMLYCHSEPFSSASEAAIHPLDPTVSIDWPESITEMSARDSAHPFIGPDFAGVSF